jgi:LAS superfamily LD-carboxypeptidase LdcB
MGKHAIIVIRNDKNEYLQYFDEKWDCYLFMNCKLEESFSNKNIIENVSNKLEIAEKEIKCTYIAEKTHKKFSESAKKEKEYQHYFYSIDIKNMPDIMKKSNFIINNKQYLWFSLNELENDDQIQKVNSDIVNYVKELKM